MDAVLLAYGKMAFHVGLHDTAGKVDGQRIVKADDGAVGAGGKGLAHVNVKPVDVRLHVLRNLHGSPYWSGQPRNFILHLPVKVHNHNVLQEEGTTRIKGLQVVAAFVVISPQRNFR